MLEATINLNSNDPAGAVPHYVQRATQTSRIGLAMESVLNAAQDLRERLEERGDDAETILSPLDQGIDATWGAIG